MIKNIDLGKPEQHIGGQLRCDRGQPFAFEVDGMFSATLSISAITRRARRRGRVT
jgi:hypothetical protein